MRTAFLSAIIINTTFALSAGLALAQTPATQQYDLRHVRWGMTKQEVIAAEGKPLAETERILHYEREIAQHRSDLGFQFRSNRLIGVIVILREDLPNLNRYEDVFDEWHNELEKKYGPAEKEYHWRDSLYKDDPENIGMAIAADHLELKSEWTLDRTVIHENAEGKEFHIDLVIAYIDKNQLKAEQDHIQNDRRNEF